MTPKKIACFVEGQTEQIFVESYFRKLLDTKKYLLKLINFKV
jgi:hypothetical protein